MIHIRKTSIHEPLTGMHAVSRSVASINNKHQQWQHLHCASNMRPSNILCTTKYISLISQKKFGQVNVRQSR